LNPPWAGQTEPAVTGKSRVERLMAVEQTLSIIKALANYVFRISKI
jgi:hypothetical protein